MSPDKEFKTREDVREYFFEELRSRTPRGRYNYRESGLVAPPGTLVLCQFQSGILADSVLLDRVNETFERNGVTYRGYLHLDVSSVRVFNRPITRDEMGVIWPGFQFSNVKQNLSLEGFAAWSRLVESIGWKGSVA